MLEVDITFVYCCIFAIDIPFGKKGMAIFGSSKWHVAHFFNFESIIVLRKDLLKRHERVKTPSLFNSFYFLQYLMAEKFMLSLLTKGALY